MMNCVVSVIVPNYCHSQYLDERILSILNQTYQDFELIILDDCSPDNGASKEVIERYRNNPHVSHIVYNKVNSGSPFKQWRRGLELAKGEYVWIAESDDSCKPTMLITLLRACVETKAVLTFCKSICFKETDKIQYINSLQKSLNNDFTLSGFDFIRLHLSEGCRIMNASSVIFRREIAMGINRQYEEMKASGDWLFWIEMAERGNVSYVNNELNYFRRLDSCVTWKNSRNGNADKEYLKIVNYLIEKKLISHLKVFQIRIKRIFMIFRKDYEVETAKSELFKLWDRYMIYRLLLPFYILYRINKKIINK